MGLHRNIKTEAGHRNGTGRWCTRREAKLSANHARRCNDRHEADPTAVIFDTVHPAEIADPDDPDAMTTIG